MAELILTVLPESWEKEEADHASPEFLLISNLDRNLGILSERMRKIPFYSAFLSNSIRQELIGLGRFKGRGLHFTETFLQEEDLDQTMMEEMELFNRDFQVARSLISLSGKLNLDDLIGLNKSLGGKGSLIRTSEKYLGGKSRETAEVLASSPDQVKPLLAGLEVYLENRGQVHPLIHLSGFVYQYLNILPFESKNMISMELAVQALIQQEYGRNLPFLPIAFGFNLGMTPFFVNLKKAQSKEELSDWNLFFLETLNQGLDLILSQTKTWEKQAEADLKIIEEMGTLGKVPKKLLPLVYENPLFYSAVMSLEDKVASKPTMYRAIRSMEKKGILEEITKVARNKTYVSRPILKLFER